MSRNEGRIGAGSESPVDAAEILAALSKEAAGGAERRKDAVSRYLSASDGWREASTVLGGTFAAGEEGAKGVEG